MKIMILGHSGSGKSTLARTLGQQLALPVLHLDSIHWMPGWQERPREQSIPRLEAFLDEHPGGWVVDGNYTGWLFERRAQEAEHILILDFPRRICLPRALNRWRKNWGRTRPDLGEGCPERFDFEFLMWILRDGRTPDKLARWDELQRKYPQKVRRLTRPRQVKALLQALEQEGTL